MLHFLNWQLITGHALGVVLQVYKALLWYTLIKKERKKKAPRTHLQWETPGVSDHHTWRIGDVVHLPFTKASTTQKLGQCITQSRCGRLVSLGFDQWNSLGLQWQKKKRGRLYNPVSHGYHCKSWPRTDWQYLLRPCDSECHKACKYTYRIANT